MKILIVEDDTKIAQFLEKGLQEEGYVTHWVKEGVTGLDAALTDEWDLVILDRMIPGMEGLTVCRKIREAGRGVPILVLSARGTLENRVEGLDSGADDYLAKPFAFSELLARVRALGRRGSVSAAPTLQVGDLVLDLVSHRVTYRGEAVELTTREFALLRLLMRRKGHVLSRTIIAESVWSYDFQGGTNVIDVYVNYLRTKLKKVSGLDMIRTLRGRGYQFVEE